MRFFDNAPTSWYEELKSYFPRWYADIAEMDALWHTWGALLDHLQADIQTVLDNYFITSCDDETIEFWENFIGVRMGSNLSLEQRRRILMTLFAGFGKCSKSKIQQLFQKLTGTEADIEFSEIDAQHNQALQVWVDIENSANWNPVDVEFVLDRVVPAHIRRDTHYWLEIGGTLGLFFGMAVYSFEKATMKMEPFDSASLNADILTDELDNMLMDEIGIIIFD